MLKVRVPINQQMQKNCYIALSERYNLRSPLLKSTSSSSLSCFIRGKWQIIIILSQYKNAQDKFWVTNAMSKAWARSKGPTTTWSIQVPKCAKVNTWPYNMLNNDVHFWKSVQFENHLYFYFSNSIAVCWLTVVTRHIFWPGFCLGPGHPKIKPWNVVYNGIRRYKLQHFRFSGCLSKVAECRDIENKENIAFKILKRRANSQFLILRNPRERGRSSKSFESLSSTKSGVLHCNVSLVA